ncbi:MAG: hypothetical protein P1U30_04210 [Phycisphaerales bacterium]|nr:hypothetical protein [Phycisphaerales bacterium]
MPAPDHPFFEQHKEVWNRIGQAALNRGHSAKVASDVAFHMLDWHEDLTRLVAFLESPSECSTKELDSLLSDFLIHVPNHIAAAAKLYTECGVQDIFGVGACNNDEEE